ncbi:peptidylprolyl isomerase domain and WD repeat-containing protein 1 [Adelges cooleyi]|uniref:peptidylprolyl isomerase domain and WD repeat-containing protein 1 n=1 Tax=Adelges cooleyi TaxID=133065 RepID=UPI00218057B3|nr:peptidylprolyl isomerase domain and WD repeat-containing protein 1 [Adelges cooleyi]
MSEKREHEDDENSDNSSEDECVGPSLSEAAEVVEKKKKKILKYEDLYLKNLPSSDTYEKSYMHRDVITHIIFTKTDFLITASCDGHVKFWKKSEELIEFVKHFRSHLTPIIDLTDNYNGTLMCTISSDQSIKVFDVINFDMINIIKLDYVPLSACWVHAKGDPIHTVAVSSSTEPKIFIYDGKGENVPLKILEKIHSKPVSFIKFNPTFCVAVSADKSGILEYWSGPKTDYQFPKCAKFESKLDTDLFEFVRHKTYPSNLCFSNDGLKFATMSPDRKVRVFHFLTGKLHRVYDETLNRFNELQQKKQQIPNIEFIRRMAIERELDKTEISHRANLCFDESGHYLFYPTMLGVKVVNTFNNTLVKIIGKPENLRVLKITLFQGKAKKAKAAVTLEMEAATNPTLEGTSSDPTLFCTAYKKNRFYMFTKREPEDIKSIDADRDVFNERPSKEDIISSTEAASIQRLYDTATLHTVYGDIQVALFKECQKTVENFCVHSKNGYYNGNIFHRVIKGFMIQTGDPTGTGLGGESIWGGEFEDEIRPHLKHDRPYTLSMANAGPGTNGSQFFITLIPTPWLDNKHTVFGRVTKGMEVVQTICSAKTHPKTDKPHDDIQIINISLK